MRSSQSLLSLNAAISGRLARLRKAVSVVKGKGLATPDPLLSYVAIELDNLVLAGIRNFMISSLTGARTATGHRVRTSPKFMDEGQVLAFSLSILSPIEYQKLGSPTRVGRRDEFKIRDPRLVERVVSACSATNAISVQIAYQLKTAVFTDLPVIRNFYAHRNDDTWRKVRTRAPALGAFGARTTDQVLLYPIISRPVTLIEDWLDDVELFFMELTQ